MDYGLFGVRFLFLDRKKEHCSIDESLIYFATPPFYESLSAFNGNIFLLFYSLCIGLWNGKL